MALREVYRLYVVTNKVNGKQYVGMTSLPVEQRWACHISAARNGAPYVFAQALRKYGPEGFLWEEVAWTTTPEAASETECALIKQLRPAYNMTEGGEGAAGLSPESRARKSAKIKDSWQDPDVRARRVAGLRAAAPSVDREAQGKKISETKLKNREIAMQQGKERVAADGGAQIRAALAARWAAPDCQNYDKSFFDTEEYRHKQRINSTIVWGRRRGEIDLWLEVGP